MAATALGQSPLVRLPSAVVMGFSMALLYPNLIAAVSDRAPPPWRGKALGTYRYWRDTGYAIGTVLLGAVTQASGAPLRSGPVPGCGSHSRFQPTADAGSSGS